MAKSGAIKQGAVELISKKVDFMWTPNSKLLLLSAVFFIILLRLGFWQIDRADQKVKLLLQEKYRQAMPAVSLHVLQQAGELENYRNVTLSGEFMNDQAFLLDNQVVRGRVGYDLIIPFQLESGERIFINRGWIAAPSTRDRLPQWNKIEGQQKLQGWLYQSHKPFILAQSKLSDTWPKVIQLASTHLMSEAVSGVDESLLFKNLASKVPESNKVVKYLPWVVRLAKNDAALLVDHWPIVNSSPEKHWAYAVQWFSMAFVLVLLNIFANSNLSRWWRARNINRR